MKTLLLSLFALFCFYGNAQNRKINYIKLESSNSIMLYSAFEVTIEWDYANKAHLTANYYKGNKSIKKEIQISSKEFDSIVEQILKINNRDLVKDFSNGLDGSTTSLEFGTMMFNIIKYDIWGLYKTDINTNYRELLLTVQLILNTANIKIDDFN